MTDRRSQVLALRNLDLSRQPMELQTQMMNQLIADLRRRPELNGTEFVIMVESDYSPACARQFEVDAVRSLPDEQLHFMRECRKDPTLGGVFKSNRGDNYVRCMRQWVRTGRLRVWEGLEQTRAEEVAELFVQLERFALVTPPPPAHGRDPLAPVQPHWSGKAGNRADDLAVALMQALYWLAVFHSNRRYDRARGPHCPRRLVRGMSVHNTAKDDVSAEEVQEDLQLMSPWGPDPLDARVFQTVYGEAHDNFMRELLAG